MHAVFSIAVILIASYRKGEGDSGSRYAMETAMNYDIERFLMYNSMTDEENEKFGLNKDLSEKGLAKVFYSKTIDNIKAIKNPYLYPEKESNLVEQTSLF